MLSPIWGITTSVINEFSGLARAIGPLIFARAEFPRTGDGNGHHLAIKHTPEMMDKPLHYIFARRSATECGHGCHRLHQSAGHDVLKITQVGGYVQREAMRGHP